MQREGCVMGFIAEHTLLEQFLSYPVREHQHVHAVGIARKPEPSVCVLGNDIELNRTPSVGCNHSTATGAA